MKSIFFIWYLVNVSWLSANCTLLMVVSQLRKKKKDHQHEFAWFLKSWVTRKLGREPFRPDSTPRGGGSWSGLLCPISIQVEPMGLFCFFPSPCPPSFLCFSFLSSLPSSFSRFLFFYFLSGSRAVLAGGVEWLWVNGYPGHDDWGLSFLSA